MRKRRLLLTAGGAAILGGCGFSLEHGLSNPCRARLPRELANDEAVLAAWEGVDPARVWDCHAHLIGTGDSGSGIWLNPGMLNMTNPAQYSQRLFFLNAGCAHDAPGRVDLSYVERMHNLLDGMRPGAKLILLAFDRYYTETGEPAPAETAFYVPNEYAMTIARRHPRYFEWAASIHPYRRDCLACAAPGEGRRRGCGQVAARRNGHESGVSPLRRVLRRHSPDSICRSSPTPAWSARCASAAARNWAIRCCCGARSSTAVRVVIAHCATMGEDRDLDRGADGPVRRELRAVRPADGRSALRRTRLFGDVSAVNAAQSRRARRSATLLERSDWHPRLLNGSDYPLPGIMPLYSVSQLAELGVIEPRLAPLLADPRAQPAAVRFRAQAPPARGEQSVFQGCVRDPPVLHCLRVPDIMKHTRVSLCWAL